MSGLDDLAAESVEDMTAGALAAHYDALAAVVDQMTAHFRRLEDVATGTDPTTYTDDRLKLATAGLLPALEDLAQALADKLLRAGHIAEGARA